MAVCWRAGRSPQLLAHWRAAGRRPWRCAAGRGHELASVDRPSTTAAGAQAERRSGRPTSRRSRRGTQRQRVHHWHETELEWRSRRAFCRRSRGVTAVFARRRRSSRLPPTRGCAGARASVLGRKPCSERSSARALRPVDPTGRSHRQWRPLGRPVGSGPLPGVVPAFVSGRCRVRVVQNPTDRYLLGVRVVLSGWPNAMSGACRVGVGFTARPRLRPRAAAGPRRRPANAAGSCAR
jgi:hypothetical protein